MEKISLMEHEIVNKHNDLSKKSTNILWAQAQNKSFYLLSIIYIHISTLKFKNEAIMKVIITSILFLILQISMAQDCNYNFSRGSTIYVLKTSTNKPGYKERSLEAIAKMQRCLEQTNNKKEMYWLNNKLANRISLVDSDDSVIDYTIAAFHLDSVLFCKEYINIHNKTQSEDSYFKPYFLDHVTDENLIEVRDYCKDTYLEHSLEIIRNYEEKKRKESESKNLNVAYMEAFKEIDANDVMERGAKKKEINWDIQGRMDSINRSKLDELYEKYGFPSKDIVKSEGVKSAFLVLHHSTDCEWNIKWTERFLEHYDEIGMGEIFQFYLFRNFNKKDGQCKNYTEYIESLKTGKYSTIVNRAQGL